MVAYPVACIPQAWAAAAPLLVLQSVLGVSADAPGGALAIERPALPGWLGRLKLDRLRVGEADVTLDFERNAGATSFALLERHGDVAVTMAAAER